MNNQKQDSIPTFEEVMNDMSESELFTHLFSDEDGNIRDDIEIDEVSKHIEGVEERAYGRGLDASKKSLIGDITLAISENEVLTKRWMEILNIYYEDQSYAD
jgi:hypothetical protein